MATFRKFEDIHAWQKAREVNRLIYQISSENDFRHDYALRDQIRRSSISIMSNIAEGFGRRSNREFANFLNYANGSTAEVQSHLYIAFDVNYIEQCTFDNTYNSLGEISRMIISLSHHLQNYPDRTF